MCDGGLAARQFIFFYIYPSVLPLQNAAEAWVKKHEPDTYELYDEAAEWRAKPLSASQATFFLRHDVPYQQYWSRGQAHAVQVKWRLEVRRGGG